MFTRFPSLLILCGGLASCENTGVVGCASYWRALLVSMGWSQSCAMFYTEAKWIVVARRGSLLL